MTISLPEALQGGGGVGINSILSKISVDKLDVRLLTTMLLGCSIVASVNPPRLTVI